MVEYVGAARKIRDADWQQLADTVNLSVAHLRTVVDVETDGHGFDLKGRIEFLFEPHVFYRLIKGDKDKLAAAIKAGCAYPAWKGPGSYPKTTDLRWALYMKAVAIDEDKAIRSASWGLGQIGIDMEYREAGYDSPQDMIEHLRDSEYNQILGMVRLFRARNLDQYLREEKWETFARLYNGAAYKKNNYHTKLASAYKRWVERLGSARPVEDDGVLRIGSKGEMVRTLQRLLNAKGYHCRIDADFGPGTRQAVLGWKACNHIDTTDERMSADLVELLEKSPPREPSAERATATVKDIKKESSIVATSENVKNIIVGAGTVLGVSEGAKQSGVLEKAENAADTAQRAKSVWQTLKGLIHDVGLDVPLQFVSDNKILILLGVGVIAYVAYNRITKARVEMHRNGETI